MSRNTNTGQIAKTYDSASMAAKDCEDVPQSTFITNIKRGGVVATVDGKSRFFEYADARPGDTRLETMREALNLVLFDEHPNRVPELHICKTAFCLQSRARPNYIFDGLCFDCHRRKHNIRSTMEGEIARGFQAREIEVLRRRPLAVGGKKLSAISPDVQAYDGTVLQMAEVDRKGHCDTQYANDAERIQDAFDFGRENGVQRLFCLRFDHKKSNVLSHDNAAAFFSLWEYLSDGDFDGTILEGDVVVYFNYSKDSVRYREGIEQFGRNAIRAVVATGPKKWKFSWDDDVRKELGQSLLWCKV